MVVTIVGKVRLKKMATREITPRSKPAQGIQAVPAISNYTRPMAVVTTLFFMWGFITCLNDILVPHLKSLFDLSYAKVMLIQFSFFSAYFLGANAGHYRS